VKLLKAKAVAFITWNLKDVVTDDQLWHTILDRYIHVKLFFINIETQ
jgi:hypothetical protein